MMQQALSAPFACAGSMVRAVRSAIVLAATCPGNIREMELAHRPEGRTSCILIKEDTAEEQSEPPSKSQKGSNPQQQRKYTTYLRT